MISVFRIEENSTTKSTKKDWLFLLNAMVTKDFPILYKC